MTDSSFKNDAFRRQAQMMMAKQQLTELLTAQRVARENAQRLAAESLPAGAAPSGLTFEQQLAAAAPPSKYFARRDAGASPIPEWLRTVASYGGGMPGGPASVETPFEKMLPNWAYGMKTSAQQLGRNLLQSMRPAGNLDPNVFPPYPYDAIQKQYNDAMLAGNYDKPGMPVLQLQPRPPYVMEQEPTRTTPEGQVQVYGGARDASDTPSFLENFMPPAVPPETDDPAAWRPRYNDYLTDETAAPFSGLWEK